YYDYIRGFQSIRITNYRNSSIANTRYIHYQATLPDRNSVPTMPGNYLLKVFLNNDTSQLLFTKRFLVVDPRVAVAAKLVQPFKVHSLRVNQRVQAEVSTLNTQINTLSPQDLKVVILQNNIWPSAVLIDRPTIYRGNYYLYNDDATEFAAGREWRWFDLRSLRLRGDRVQNIVDTSKRTEVYINTDGERRNLLYTYYRDQNGLFTIVNMDGYNPYWQGDYGYVHFTYTPPGNRPYPEKDLYIFGELTNYASDEASRMIFNEEKGVYEGTLFLKQGYYDYTYVTVETKEGSPGFLSFETTEGNFNTTENNYTVLIYYRAFGARADELIGFAQLSSTILR
ncbi:MAG TPA: type IX secretion system plug protein domain-containing protein, partial [Chitinophagaceae bacterium]